MSYKQPNIYHESLILNEQKLSNNFLLKSVYCVTESIFKPQVIKQDIEKWKH